MLNLITVRKATDTFKFAPCRESLLTVIYWAEELIQKSFTHDLIARYLWLESHKGLVKEQDNYYALNVEKRQIDNELGDRQVNMTSLDEAVEVLNASEIKDFRLVVEECYKMANNLTTPPKGRVKARGVQDG